MTKAKLTIEEVEHVAKLANLKLTESELVDFQEKLSKTLEYVDQLQSIDTSKVVATSQVTGKTNELREDLILPSFSQEESLANAPISHNGYFVAKIKWN